MQRLILALLFLAATLAPAHAQTPQDETAVRALIAEWYERVSHKKADAPWVLMAPGGQDGGPGYSVPADLHSGSAAIRGPYINHELAARAMQFTYDITAVKLDPRFARVMVWERGYFFASAAQKTYENAASTLFLLEKIDSGEWKILYHHANSAGMPPNRITDPMPDLRDEYYRRCGEACDPVADARKAAEW